MCTKGKHIDSLGWWIQGVIFDKLAVDRSDSLDVFNSCTKYQPCDNPEVIVTEVIENIESSCDGVLKQCLPLSPTKEQLSVLIDSNSPRHNQLAAVFQLSDFPRSRPCSRSRSRSRSRSISPNLLSLEFIHSIESDSKSEQAVLEEPRGKFFRTATNLNSKLEDLNVEAGNMLCEMVLLKHGLQELETNTDNLLQETKQLREELQDLCYLDDLIHLLNGQLDRITLRRWPFSAAHSTSLPDMNLVI